MRGFGVVSRDNSELINHEVIIVKRIILKIGVNESGQNDPSKLDIDALFYRPLVWLLFLCVIIVALFRGSSVKRYFQFGTLFNS